MVHEISGHCIYSQLTRESSPSPYLCTLIKGPININSAPAGPSDATRDRCLLLSGLTDHEMKSEERISQLVLHLPATSSKYLYDIVKNGTVILT